MKRKALIILAVLGLYTLNCFAQSFELHGFDGSTSEGEYPTGSLIYVGGSLYGMTFNCSTGLGSVLFKINPSGTGFTRLIGFAFDSDGFEPEGSLTYDGTFLYGMTTAGGTNNKGIIFKVKPDGTGYAKLFDFSTSTGNYPMGDLVVSGSFLYGMTPYDGTNGYGTIFKIKNDGTGFSKLRDLTAADGATTKGSLITDGTFLYGLTNAGGTSARGAIFKIKEDGTGFTILYSLSSSTGYYPAGSLVSDGTFLYGMTQRGGTIDSGTIFRIMPDGTGFSTIYSFTGINGKNPWGSLIYDGTLLYGMTRDGGTGIGGVLFSIHTDGSGFSNLSNFGIDLHAYHPRGNPVSDGSSLYGMVEQGGLHNFGTIFKYGSTSTGITATNKKAIDYTVSPNPFSSQTFFKFDQEQKNTIITVTDLLGKLVRIIPVNGFEAVVNKDELRSGVYFYSIRNENGSIANGKIVIN